MELKFKNNSIEKYKSNNKDFFDKKGRSKPVITSFKMVGRYKGLCLREYVNGAKHFIVRFRLRGDREKLRIFPVGKFDPTLSVKTGEVLFGTKECEERLFSIVKEHCDDLGRWVKNPNETIRFNKVIKRATIGKVIEAYCKKGFPKIGRAEKFRGVGIRNTARVLIGYNKRTSFLDYDDDDFGEGRVIFRSSKRYNEGPPKDWDDLFKRYPPRKGMVKQNFYNRYGVTSIYDSPLSEIAIENLTGQMIISFRKNFGSYWSKYEVKEDFRRLWKFAISEGYIDVGIKPDPTNGIEDIKPKKKPYKFHLKIFSDDHLELLLEIAEEKSRECPWQSEVIILMPLTGLRGEEIKRLKKTDIKWEHEITWTKDGKKVETFGQIHLRPGVTKTGEEEWINITKEIKDTLENTLDLYKRAPQTGYDYDLSYYKRVPWLFSTRELQIGKLFDKDYINSKKTRLKTYSGCFSKVKAEMRKRLNIPENEEYLCSQKMLRKTHTHQCKLALEGRSDIAKRHTRHKTEAILEGAYDGSTSQEKRESAVKVSATLIKFAPKRRAS